MVLNATGDLSAFRFQFCLFSFDLVSSVPFSHTRGERLFRRNVMQRTQDERRQKYININEEINSKIFNPLKFVFEMRIIMESHNGQSAAPSRSACPCRMCAKHWNAMRAVRPFVDVENSRTESAALLPVGWCCRMLVAASRMCEIAHGDITVREAKRTYIYFCLFLLSLLVFFRSFFYHFVANDKEKARRPPRSGCSGDTYLSRGCQSDTSKPGDRFVYAALSTK